MLVISILIVALVAGGVAAWPGSIKNFEIVTAQTSVGMDASHQASRPSRAPGETMSGSHDRTPWMSLGAALQ